MISKFCGYFLRVAFFSCATVHAKDLGKTHVVLGGGAQNQVHVTANGVSLSEVLNEFSRVLGVDVQQGTLSSKLKTLNCEAEEPRLLLKCITGEGVSFMIQSQRKDCGASPSNWCGIRVKVWQDAPDRSRQDDDARLHQIAPDVEELLKSSDADQRATGIDLLLANQAIEGRLAISLLKDLSRDSHSTVRASAIHGMAVFEGWESQALIQEAVHDSDAEVRLMAIDGIAVSEDTREILEAAMNDENSEIRELAGARLERLYTIRRSKEE